MKNILVKSVFDAFDYVMEHYYPFGMEENVQLKDTYAVISIQDTHTDGFGLTFTENHFCKGVLTLYFDDIIKDVEGAVLFTDEMADQIIAFVLAHKDVDTLLIHCFAGESRSQAVGAFVTQLKGRDNSRFFIDHDPNEYVYELLEDAWLRYMLSH